MKKILLISALVIGLLGLVGGYQVISIYTETRNTGNDKELALNAQYKGMMADYGQFRTAFYDQLGIARDKRDAIDKVMTDAISGRYNKPGSPQVDNGKFFSAVTEAYPDLKGLDIYDRIMDFIVQGRARFSQRQEQMAESVRQYDLWRRTGSFLHPTVVKWCGFPSDVLEIKLGDKVYHGQEALNKMSTAIMSAETQKIFDSGTDERLDMREQK